MLTRFVEDEAHASRFRAPGTFVRLEVRAWRLNREYKCTCKLMRATWLLLFVVMQDSSQADEFSEVTPEALDPAKHWD